MFLLKGLSMLTDNMCQFYFSRLLQYFERIKAIHCSLLLDKLSEPFYNWLEHLEASWIQFQEYAFKATQHGCDQDLVRRYFEVAERMYFEIYRDCIY